jgi:hypothetical protein
MIYGRLPSFATTQSRFNSGCLNVRVRSSMASIDGLSYPKAA